MTRLAPEKLRPIHFSQQIASRLEALILSNELQPGDRLPSERELAKSFGVSRSAVREALKLLVERRLVETRMGRGTIICDPGVSSVISSLSVASRMQNSTLAHLDEVRPLLEVHIAGLAAERAEPADLERMEAAVEAMDATIGDMPRFIEADMEFHAAVAAATQNPLFLILGYSILDLVQKMRAMLTTPDEMAIGQAFHKRLLECMKRKDSSGARETMAQHLGHVAAVRRRADEACDQAHASKRSESSQ